MQRQSAGLLMYRLRDGELQVFLAHPGGPLYRNKDDGHWSIPKGEPPEGESLIDAATREFEEETGLKPGQPLQELGFIRQKGGKIVHAWAFEGDWDESQPICSNTFEMEWPPRSGKRASFPEMDKAAFFSINDAKKKIKAAQWLLIERLVTILDGAKARE